ncbi:MAG: hypothetical protein ABIK85_04075 [Candidatus Eisenbacteria bacterium]
MRPDAADPSQPQCGPDARSLGARVPRDIEPDDKGNVHPGTGGMSVSPDDPRNLPQHRRPPSLGGTGKDPMFVIADVDLGASLVFRPDARNPGRHGFVEPASIVAVEAYQRALCDTAPNWRTS